MPRSRGISLVELGVVAIKLFRKLGSTCAKNCGAVGPWCGKIGMDRWYRMVSLLSLSNQHHCSSIRHYHCHWGWQELSNTLLFVLPRKGKSFWPTGIWMGQGALTDGGFSIWHSGSIHGMLPDSWWIGEPQNGSGHGESQNHHGHHRKGFDQVVESLNCAPNVIDALPNR